MKYKKMKSIYLVRTYTGTFPSRLINLFLREEYVHISISFSEDLSDTYGFGKIKSINPIHGGIQKENMNNYPFIGVPCEIYELSVSSTDYKRIKEQVYNTYENRDLYSFNLLGLITAYFKIEWERKRSYYCSEFIAEVLQNANLLDKSYKPSVTTPKELINGLDDLSLIYKGNLSSYSELRKPSDDGVLQVQHNNTI